MKICLVHDYLTQRGGAERVVLAFHRMFPAAPIYTSLYDPDGTFAELRGADIRPSALQRLPHRGDAFRRYLPLYPLAFEAMRLDRYDLVLSSSSGWAHGARGGGRHVCYCHNPARWLYQPDEYLAQGAPIGRAARVALRPVLAALRRWDQRAAARPTTYVANSRAVARRIRATYGRPAPVVHPPVDVERAIERRPSGVRRGRHYLVVARLLPYKRVDLAIAACNRRRAPLVIVGDGPARAYLERLAGPTVRFAGRVTDGELGALYDGARALLQCGEEDFGIVPLEANARGVPVVAYGASGALETVIDGVTGVLFHRQDEATVLDALDRLEGARWSRSRLVAHARTFDEPRFAAQMDEIVRAPALPGSAPAPGRVGSSRAGASDRLAAR